jgi:hypothetical protein
VPGFGANGICGDTSCRECHRYQKNGCGFHEKFRELIGIGLKRCGRILIILHALFADDGVLRGSWRIDVFLDRFL